MASWPEYLRKLVAHQFAVPLPVKFLDHELGFPESYGLCDVDGSLQLLRLANLVVVRLDVSRCDDTFLFAVNSAPLGAIVGSLALALAPPLVEELPRVLDLHEQKQD